MQDEKMFHIGIWMAAIVIVLTAMLQVCYRVQDRARAKIKREIVVTQQKSAIAAANFAAFVRPEILRNAVTTIYPKAASIGFNKTVSVDEL